MKIICKTTLLPPPVVRETRITIRLDDPSSLAWGMQHLVFASGHQNVEIDWDDGCCEEIKTGGAVTHTYPRAGEYVVRIADGVSELRCSTKTPSSVYRTTYAKAIREFVTNAALLIRLGYNGFYDAANLATFQCEGSGLCELGPNTFGMCPALRGRIALPGIIKVSANSFIDCPNITELQFSKENEAIITALAGYETHFGAENAVVSFD